MNRKRTLLAGMALSWLICQPALAQSTADVPSLEARIAALEAQISALKNEVATSNRISTGQPDIIRLPAQPQPQPVVSVNPVAVQPEGFRIGQNTLRMGGFIKTDFIASRYSSGDPSSGDALRDFYLPGAIPVGGTPEGTTTDFNARQTRFWLSTEGTIAGRKVATRLELDFEVLPGTGDQRITSASTPGLRRAYVSIDRWLFGQEWTNFQNLAVLPDTADYVGSSEGTVFARQAQIRYTQGPISIAIENPETTLSPWRASTRIIADDNALPDLTLRYALSRPWGEASIAGLLRQLKYETTGIGAINSTSTGWGLSAAAKLKIGERHDLRVMLTTGEGIGRYVGLNLANDAVLDERGRLQPIALTAGLISYRHVWSPQWRSNLTLSAQEVDNDARLASPSSNASAASLRGNLIWSPVPAMDVGTELMFGERKLVSGLSGDMTRLQFFARYGF